MRAPVAIDQPSALRAAHYAAAADTALTKALWWRSEWRRTGERIDRTLMRQLAMEWRDYRRLAARFR
jgi:hypothetical protein